MKYKIRLAEIPFFHYVNPSFAKKLGSIFTIAVKEAGETVLEYGQNVPGFYLVAEGKIDVYARNSNVHITTLEVGSTFGEMSLIDKETSSATLKAAERCVMIECNQDKFAELLSDDFVFAAAFYKGAAHIISNRLRDTNNLIEEEMEKSRTVIEDMVRDDGIIEKIGHTQGSLNNTGESMISKLTALLPACDELKAEGGDIGVKTDAMKKSIKDIITIDSQNFDIISQQMDQINQHLINIQRLMSGLDIHEVSGDTRIFEIKHDQKGADDEDAITFF